MGVLKTAREVGISIPGDLALAGYGDHWPKWEPKQPNPCLASSTANIPHPQSTGYPALCGYVDPCVRGLLHTIPINLPENADWARLALDVRSCDRRYREHGTAPRCR